MLLLGAAVTERQLESQKDARSDTRLHQFLQPAGQA